MVTVQVAAETVETNIHRCMDERSDINSPLMGLRLKKYVQLRENRGPSANNRQ